MEERVEKQEAITEDDPLSDGKNVHPASCNVCSKVFQDSSMLTIHMWIHISQARKLDEQCVFSASKTTHLKSHKKIKHCSKETKVETVEQNNPKFLKRNVNVRIKKLDYSKYLRSQDKLKTVDTVFIETSDMSVADTEAKREDTTEQDPVFIETSDMSVADTEVKREDTIEHDPVFIETSDMSVADTEVKKEDTTEQDPVFIETSDMNVADTEVKKEDTTEQDPVFIETSDMNVADTEVKREDTTEEDPLSNTNQTTTSTFKGESGHVKEDNMYEQLVVKKEFEDEDCDLETKIEIVDDILPLTREETLFI